ncbi:MAG TPA: acyl carrier protein [Clostridiales bacterium]|nr:acyl carrier protein [Clostridiales bacterium]
MVFEKVKSIIVDQLDVDAEKITLDSKVAEDLGADSLDVVDLIMSIEEEFDMEIDDDAVEKMKTVGDIVAFIDSNNK